LDIPGRIDITVPHHLGPKKTSVSHKFFNLSKEILQHKLQCIALKEQRTKKNKGEAAKYAKLLAKRMKEVKEKHQEQTAKRRKLSSTFKSESNQK
jgi:small subunit ribosomal protein S6e